MKKYFSTILVSVLIIVSLALIIYVYIVSSDLPKNSAAKNMPSATTDNSLGVPASSQDSANIHVFQPKNGDTVGLPLKILGEARVFENQFAVRIKDAKGNIISEESVMAANGDAGQFNLFQKDINYPAPTTDSGTIEFFQYSAKDGSETDKVIINVKFEKVYNALNIKVYFGNSQKDPKSTDCNKVYPVYRRIAYTKDTAKMAVLELLKGPTADEVSQGYSSNINVGTNLKSLNIVSGKAMADFDSTLQSGVSGECKATSIRSQITETIKQFGTANSVTISIDGKSDGILQP